MIINLRCTDACKDRYDGKCAKVDTIAIQRTANGEESFGQLI